MLAEYRAAGFVPGTNNPIIDSFNALPSPEEHHCKPWAHVAPRVHRAIRRFQADARRNQRSDDPEFQVVKRAVDATFADFAKGEAALYDHLAAYALSATIEPEDQSTKAKQLRYICWVAQGRNDSTSPFGSSQGQSAQGTQLCAGCNTVSDLSKLSGCTGCRLHLGGKTFTTWYCNTDCQARHWKHHKQPCMATRALVRAVSIFNEVFRHFLAITYHSRFKITSIAVVQGLVVATTDEDASGPGYTVGATEADAGFTMTTVTFNPSANHTTKWSRFPLTMADDKNAALAVLTHGYCSAPVNDLLEALIRRKCALELSKTPGTLTSWLIFSFVIACCESIRRVIFDAKNMVRPVRITSPHSSDFSAIYAHEVFKVALRGGAQFAIDFTGLQMGWDDTVVPWQTYERRHILRIHADFAFQRGTEPLVDLVPLDPAILGMKDERQTELMTTALTPTLTGAMDKALYCPESNFQRLRAKAVVDAKEKLDRVAEQIMANTEE